MVVLHARAAAASLTCRWASADQSRPCDRLVRLSGAFAFGIAVLTLLGWTGDIAVLKSGLPHESATQPLAAVCFALCGISLGLSTEPRGGYIVLSRALTISVLLAVVAFIWQNALDTEWGFDRLLFPDAVANEQPGQFLRPGRPAGGVLVGLALLCGCLLLAHARSAAAKAVYVAFATAGVLLSITVLIAYAFSLRALYPLGFYAQVSLNAGVEMAVLVFGVLLRRPEIGWITFLTGDSAGAISARRILVWMAALLVILTGVVQLSLTFHDDRFTLTWIAIGLLGVFLAGLAAHARRLNAARREQDRMASDSPTVDVPIGRAGQSDAEFLDALAHELRNRLGPLRNGIEIVRHLSGSYPALMRTADMMTRQVKHLVDSIDNMGSSTRPASESHSWSSDSRSDPRPPQQTIESMRLRILIADDNADGAATLAMLLQLEGHEVVTAPDGHTAVEVAETFRPDVILMDIAMPRLDGVEAARRIRASPWGRHIRVVALTAWGQDAERRRTEEAGMEFHLVKPVDLQALAAILSPGKSLDS